MIVDLVIAHLPVPVTGEDPQHCVGMLKVQFQQAPAPENGPMITDLTIVDGFWGGNLL